MQGDDLDRKAKLRALIRKLRADCIFYGCDEFLVMRWPLEVLLRERDRAIRRLMTEAPSGRTATWDG